MQPLSRPNLARNPLPRGFRWGFLLLLAIVIAACATPPPVVTLSISPTSATVTVGDGATTFTATLTGSTGTIAWSLSGPGTIDNATGTTTSYTPPATGTAGTATLTATAGSATGNATITINAPSSITVSGTVVDIFGVPQSALAVKIGSSATNTDTNGNFTIASVTTPYNAIVIDAVNSTGFVFEGLTLAAPTLQLISFTGGAPANSATIATGNLSGGAGFPNPASHSAVVSYGSPEAFSGQVTTAGPSYTPLAITWGGSPSTTGALHALQFVVDGAGLPTDYTGYGTTALTLSNGGTFNSTATDVALSSGLGELSFSGSSAIPSVYTVAFTELYTDFGTNQNLPVVFDASGALNFSYNTPNVAGSTTTTIITAAPPIGTGLSAAYATGVPSSGTAPPVSVPEIPALVLPASGATGVTLATTFDWQTFPGGLHVAVFTIGGTTYVVTTTNSQTTIPDLSAEGLPLPASTAGSWQTLGVAPFLSMDAAAGPTGYTLDLLKAFGSFGLVAPEADGSFGLSSQRTFTTAP
jgi:hypothetical protein